MLRKRLTHYLVRMMTLGNILILGAGGMLGTMLRRYLKARTRDSLFFQSRRNSSDIALVWSLGVSEFSILERFILEKNVKKIVMLYGGRSATESNNGIDLELIEGCFEVFNKANVDRILVASSSAVYADKPGNIYREEDPVSSCGAYQKEKVNLEILSKKFSDQFEDLLLMRLSNVLGADSLTKQFVYSKNHKFSLNKYKNGFLKRSYLSPSSFAHIIDDLLYSERKLPSVMNISTYQELSMDQILIGLGVPFSENIIQSAGRNVILDNSLLNSFVELPSEYADMNFALADLKAHKSWVGNQIDE